jgi:hypothetical protein
MLPKLAVTVCATKNYCYAMAAQARRVAPQLRGYDAEIILAGDTSKEFRAAAAVWRNLGCKVTVVELPDAIEGENYKESAQILIARLRTAVLTRARAAEVDYCWSLDSDVLPPPNALRCMVQMLEFDDGYYGVAACPYPSQGGGAFLCGRGTPQNHILDDFVEEEREIPAELAARRDALEAKFQALTEPASAELQEEARKLREEIKHCPPQGNVFAMNAKRWRRRGWFDHAYPGIGVGAVVPSDWCGFGCTLMGRRALDLAHFDGYEGKGTEDLYVVWTRWHPAGIRIAAIPHCPCDHVIRRRGEDGKQHHDAYTLCHAFHEGAGECVGHLRQRHIPWIPV